MSDAKHISLADHLKAMRKQREALYGPVTSREARDMAAKVNARKFLDRLRTVRWPKDDPLNGAQVAFILNVGRSAITKLMQRGDLPYTRATGTAGGSPAYCVTKADLQRYIDRRVAASKKLLGESD